MKKTFKIFRIIALVAVVGFFMTACKDNDDYPDSPKQFIQVTDIPSIYNYKYGYILLYQPGSSDISVYSAMEKIKGSSYSFPLYRWGKNDPWEGSGSFRVNILIFENATTEQWIYAGVITETDIINKTVITWSSFTDKTGSP